MDLVCPRCKKILKIQINNYLCSNCDVFFPIKNGIPCFIDERAENDGFTPEMLKYLAVMEEKHFWHKGRKKIIYQIIKQCINGKINDLRMLEIGCGNGDVLRYLENKGINIEGGDISMEGLKFCQKKINVPLYQIDALNTPFPDESFDIIGLFDLMEHIEDDDSLLKEVFRICKKNGEVIITVPAHNYLWSYFDVISGHKRRYGKKDLIRKLENAGFKIEKISYFNLFLFPIILIFRKFDFIKNYKYKNYKYKNYKYKTDAKTLKLLETKTIPIVNDIFLFFSG